MTDLLERALTKVQQLSPAEQDAIAAIIIVAASVVPELTRCV
jgi:hypothetical protein